MFVLMAQGGTKWIPLSLFCLFKIHFTNLNIYVQQKDFLSVTHTFSSSCRGARVRIFLSLDQINQSFMFVSLQSYDKCFLGSSETADANRLFCGQLAAVYVFSEALNPAQIFAMHQLGPGYKVCD